MGLGFGGFAGDLAVDGGVVLEEAEPEAHVEPVQGLGEGDADAAECFVFARLGFDAALRGGTCFRIEGVERW